MLSEKCKALIRLALCDHEDFVYFCEVGPSAVVDALIEPLNDGEPTAEELLVEQELTLYREEAERFIAGVLGLA